jgi:hypothetical protein
MPDELHRVEIKGNLNGQFRENVMHWKIIGATNDTPFQNSNALVQFLHTTIKPLFLACLPPDYCIDAIFARRLGPTGGPYASVDYGFQVQPGTRGAQATSEQLCPCITMIPGMGIKSAGRIFMPAVADTDYNLNVAANTYVTAINALMAGMVAGGSVAGGTAQICIFSRKLNISYLVSAYNLSPVIGYQRRRARPVGA